MFCFLTILIFYFLREVKSHRDTRLQSDGFIVRKDTDFIYKGSL